MPWLVLGLSVLSTFGAGKLVEQQARDKDNLRLGQAVQSTLDRIETRLTSYLLMLQAGTGVIRSESALTPVAWKEFVNSFPLERDYRGIQGIGWAARLLPEDVPGFRHRLGLSDAWRVFPDGSGAEKFPIVFLEPRNPRNQVALGYDMFSEPTRRTAMEAARDTGKPAMTQRVELVQEIESEKQPGFLIYVPVYQGDRIPVELSERRSQLRGFVYSPFRAGDLFAGIFGRETNPRLSFRVFDGTENRDQNLLYASHAPMARHPLRQSAELVVAGRPWRLDFTTTPQFESSSSLDLVPLTWLVGILMSTMLFALSRSQAQAMADAREAASRAEANQQKLVALAESMRKQSEKSRFFALASAALAEDLDYEGTLSKVARLAVPALADWCAVDLLEDDQLRRVTVVHVDPDKEQFAREAFRRYPPRREDPRGIWQVLRSGESEMVAEIPDAMLVQAARDPEHLQLLRDVQLRSYMCVPLKLRGQVIGAISFVGTHAREPFQADDLTAAEELARRAALSVENAVLFREKAELIEQVQQANEMLERRVQERTAELKESNQELEAFSYSVSHDLRSPLRHITGFAQLLQKRAGKQLDPTCQNYVETILAAAGQGGQLVDDLLAFSRMSRSELKKQPVPLTEMCRRIWNELEPEREGHPITLDLSPMPTVQADPAMLKLVLTNLLDNAIKYTRARPEPRVRVWADQNPGEVVVHVQDNGVGFNMEFADKLFGVFQRLHHEEQFEGTGIGLAHVRRIIGRHGGRTWAEGQVNGGATFHFSLPQKDESTPVQ